MHKNQKHGHAKRSADGKNKPSPEYVAWLSMKARCNCKKSTNYKNYGERGVEVCERWAASFENFMSDMGRRPSPDHSIDRIDTDGNYEPGNCRWATSYEQANNKRTSRFIRCSAGTKTIADWSKETGVSESVIAARLDRLGWDADMAVFTPERTSATGLKGVYWDGKRKKWSARFTRNKVLYDFGRFDTLLDAAAAILGNREAF